MKVQLLFSSKAGKLGISCPGTGCLRAAPAYIINVGERLQSYGAVAILVDTVLEIPLYSKIQIQRTG